MFEIPAVNRSPDVVSHAEELAQLRRLQVYHLSLHPLSRGTHQHRALWVWAVVFEKWSSLRRVNRDADGFEDRFWSGGSLDDLFDSEGGNPAHPMAAGLSGTVTVTTSATMAPSIPTLAP